jgi:hypothetical protein
LHFPLEQVKTRTSLYIGARVSVEKFGLSADHWPIMSSLACWIEFLVIIGLDLVKILLGRYREKIALPKKRTLRTNREYTTNYSGNHNQGEI